MWRFLSSASVVIALAFAFAGCDGSDGGGSNASGNGVKVISRGDVNKIGSITVNGVKYIDGQAKVIGDSPDMTVADARKLGVMVEVRGLRYGDDKWGVANVIDILCELRGDITAISATGFTVLGQEVIVDGAVEWGGVAGLGGLLVGDRVEVYGVRDANDAIRATRVEKIGLAGPEDEVRGMISALAGNSITVGGTVFMMDGATTVIDPPGSVLAVGQIVEIHIAAGNTVARIEIEDPLPDGEVEIEGFISGFTDISATFMVDDVVVDASGAEIQGGFPIDLANNMRIEVEGEMVGGILIADELKLLDSIEIEANAEAVSAGDVTLLGKTVMVTVFTTPNDLALVLVGDGVKMRGFLNTDGTITATGLERLSSPMNANELLLQGPVGNFNAGARTLTIIGIAVDASGPGVKFKDDGDDELVDTQISADAFFGSLSAGETIVKAVGSYAAGTLHAKELEFE